ncbi:MAG TPA: sensor histidine kinase [Planctomycetaceae bacterium]|nr:sensor histidine kinase [Planctomycetaceae bacterium]
MHHDRHQHSPLAAATDGDRLFASRAMEGERRRIARELHDSTGQLLASLAMRMGLLEQSIKPTEETTAQFQVMGRLVQQINQELRRLGSELRPSVLDDFGLVPAAAQHISLWSEHSGVAAELRSAPFVERLCRDAETALYRVLQESLTNIMRHADATRVDVQLERGLEGAILIIEDNGCGFDVGTALPSSGNGLRLGLRTMRERIALLDGVLTIESRPGWGTRLEAKIDAGPCAHSASDGLPMPFLHAIRDMHDQRDWSDLRRKELRQTIEESCTIGKRWQQLQKQFADREDLRAAAP